MKLKINNKDIIVVDRGLSRKEGQKRFFFIVDDTNNNLVDNYGEPTDMGKKVVSTAMSNEAIKAGATQILGSTCVDGGDVSLYSDDSTLAFNGGDKALFINPELGKQLIEEGLATEIPEPKE